MILFRHSPQLIQKSAEIRREQGELTDNGWLNASPQGRAEIPGSFPRPGCRETRRKARDLFNLNIATRGCPLEADIRVASRRILGTNLHASRYKFGVQHREDEGVNDRAIWRGEAQSPTRTRDRM